MYTYSCRSLFMTVEPCLGQVSFSTTIVLGGGGGMKQNWAMPTVEGTCPPFVAVLTCLATSPAMSGRHDPSFFTAVARAAVNSPICSGVSVTELFAEVSKTSIVPGDGLLRGATRPTAFAQSASSSLFQLASRKRIFVSRSLLSRSFCNRLTLYANSSASPLDFGSKSVGTK